MTMSIGRLILYIVAFAFLSYGSGLIVNTIKSFTRRLRIPPFVFSFFVVGALTSVTEVAVGINALSLHKPEIFVGSLLGGTIVLFLVVIPLLALFNGGVRIHKHLSSKNLLVTLGIITIPSLFALDRVVTNTEGFVLIALYICLFYIVKSKKGTLNKVTRAFERERTSLRHNTLLRLGVGGGLVFFSSRYIVEQTLVLADHYHISAFLVSLVVIAMGSTLPEIALAFRSLNDKIEDVALGDFLGSAAFNVLLFGIFTLVHNGEVTTAKSFNTTFIFVVLGVTSFYVLTRGKRRITPLEGFGLLGVYGAFVALQVNSAF
jgi:cation:H+ antiporter